MGGNYNRLQILNFHYFSLQNINQFSIKIYSNKFHNAINFKWRINLSFFFIKTILMYNLKQHRNPLNRFTNHIRSSTNHDNTVEPYQLPLYEKMYNMHK